MIIEKYKAAIDNQASTLSYLKLLLVGMVLIVVAMSFAIYKMSGSERIVIVPPGINKTFWVEADNAAPEYLEQMAYFMAQLALSVTPSNARFQLDLLLKHTSPTYYLPLKQANEHFLKRIAKEPVITFFSVQKMDTNQKEKAVVMTGIQTTFLNGSKLADRPKKFLIQFGFEGGKLTLNNFKELSLGMDAEQILSNIQSAIKKENERNEQNEQDGLLPVPSAAKQ